MKTFFKTVLNIVESVARARAASVLTRQGKIEEAKKLYN